MNAVPQNFLNFIVRLDSEPTPHFILENVPDKYPLPQKVPCMSSTPTTSDPVQIGAPVAEQTRWSKAYSLCEAFDLQQAFSDNDEIETFSQELTDEVYTHLMAHHSCQNPNIPNRGPLSSLSSLTHLNIALHTPWQRSWWGGLCSRWRKLIRQNRAHKFPVWWMTSSF